MRFATIVGARPQFIKASTISRAIRARDDIEEVLIHTGQHYDTNMSGVFFEELGLKLPDFSLDVANLAHGAMTGLMMQRLEPVLVDKRPDAVIVFGDTNSTLAGALVASKLNIPVAHIEAGLRATEPQMPEEINRRLTDHMSTLLFAPTSTAVNNLSREGIRAGVFHVGDVNYDAVLYARTRAGVDSPSNAETGQGKAKDRYSILTVHRERNTATPDRLKSVLEYVRRDVATNEAIVFPIHPRTRTVCERYGIDLSDFDLLEPQPYFAMQKLLAGATRIFTDSGGLQKEAYFHGVPSVVLRDTTEWSELLESGWSRLWSDPEFASPRQPVEEFGDGNAATRIVDTIVDCVRTKKT